MQLTKMPASGTLVKCAHTGRVGIVIETMRASWAMMVLVKWPDAGEKWVDAAELSEAQ